MNTSDSPFSEPALACRDCGKPIEQHHATYCHPRSAFATSFLVAFVAFMLAALVVLAFVR